MDPIVLAVGNGSDGTGAGPSGQATGHVRNDAYFRERLATEWVKSEGKARRGETYMLDRLPTGYAGYEKQRDNSKHVDRYLFGHPNGQFRSIAEAFPHFKYLQDYGGSAGCTCKKCAGSKPATGASNKAPSAASSSPTEQSRYFAPSATSQSVSNGQGKKRSSDELPQGRLGSDPPTSRRKQVDDEGTPDLYRNLLDSLKGAEPAPFEELIADRMSPDWRAGHIMLQAVLDEWISLPKFVPRVGELVLFARSVSEEAIAWDSASQALRRVDSGSKSWLERVDWEVGVVTQMPIEPLSTVDLTDIPEQKKNVAYSGFRIEPLSEPGSQKKALTIQHKYVPLHALRPFSFWKDCVNGVSKEDWHPTMRHALTVANSFCVIGRYSFKGTWPEATVFARGVYIGAELILVGDTVRLLPSDPKQKSISDAMVITSIRLRFVNLDQASDDEYDEGHPYHTCLHVTGRPFTLDPKKSFNGIAKAPATLADGLPKELAGFGTFFHVLDPNDKKLKLELPYNRILGRVVEHVATKAWFSSPSDMPPPSSFQAVNTKVVKPKVFDMSQGFSAIQEARSYSLQHDARIDRQAGKSWFWAGSRIEQLDLYEINGRFVGVKDETRSKKQLNAWRQALKVLDGKRGGVEQYSAAKQQREAEQRRESAQAPLSSFGLMAASAQQQSGTDDEKDELEDSDRMDINASVFADRTKQYDNDDDNDDEEDGLGDMLMTE